MKIRDEYFVWAVVIAVIVFAVVYSLNTREHLVTPTASGGVPATCPAGTVLGSTRIGWCSMSNATGVPVVSACPSNTEFNSNYNLCMPVTTVSAATTTSNVWSQYTGTTPPLCGMNYDYNASRKLCVGLNATVNPQTQTPVCPTGTTFSTSLATCILPRSYIANVVTTPSAVSTQLGPGLSWGSSAPYWYDDDGDGNAASYTSSSSGNMGSGWSNNVSGSSGSTGGGGGGSTGGGEGSTAASWTWASGFGPGNAYISKSSLVPCTCTKHSMGCERHAGSKDSSTVPGDKDGAFADGGNSDQSTAQNQMGLMRPFSSAFENQGEPTGFLNSFSAFG